jgi:ParB-like chromosome segregation protein Spo0J
MKITPYYKNAKKHPPKQIEQIANSIKEFGMHQPVVVDKEGVIIVGHGRYEAMKHLEWTDAEIQKHVKVADLTEEQAKAYRLADNKLNETDWDMDMVTEELSEMDEYLQRLSGFDVDALLNMSFSHRNSELIEENTPNETKTKECPNCGYEF